MTGHVHNIHKFPTLVTNKNFPWKVNIRFVLNKKQSPLKLTH